MRGSAPARKRSVGRSLWSFWKCAKQNNIFFFQKKSKMFEKIIKKNFNGHPYDLNSLGDIQKLAIPFGFCLQTAEKLRGQLEIRRFLDQTNRLGATYFWKIFERTKHTKSFKFSENSKKIRKKFRNIFEKNLTKS